MLSCISLSIQECNIATVSLSNLDAPGNSRHETPSKRTRSVWLSWYAICIYLIVIAHLLYIITGMISFLKEYVIVRKIPITKLLYAFDVYLVSLSSRRSNRSHFPKIRFKNCASNILKPCCTWRKSSYPESEFIVSWFSPPFLTPQMSETY